MRVLPHFYRCKDHDGHNNNRKMTARATKGKTDCLIWTDDEVELLLRVTLNYKTTKCVEGVNWESCQSKYADILLAFRQQYCTGGDTAKDFPHEPNDITKAQVTAKLKAVRNKFRHSVDAGRRSGFGRVVYMFYPLCKEIWAGSPGTDALPTGFQSSDLVDLVETASSSSAEPADTAETASSESTADQGETRPEPEHQPEINRRRNMLQAKLNNHRSDRLKRKAPADALAQEDLRIKRQMMEMMADSENHFRSQLRFISDKIQQTSNAMVCGVDLLREIKDLVRHQVQAPRSGTSHPHPHPLQPLQQNSQHPYSLHPNSPHPYPPHPNSPHPYPLHPNSPHPYPLHPDSPHPYPLHPDSPHPNTPHTHASSYLDTQHPHPSHMQSHDTRGHTPAHETHSYTPSHSTRTYTPLHPRPHASASIRRALLQEENEETEADM